MAGSVNKAILVGNLGRDPEIRAMQNGKSVVSFSLATTESWRDKATGEPILSAGIYRVNGNLALSRAVGDRSERPAVTAEPDITYMQVLETVMMDDQDSRGNDRKQEGKKQDEQPQKNSQREYVVLATDGLWDVFTNQNVVDIVDLLLDKATVQQRPQIAEVLVREALRRGAYDNVTVIIIWLHTPGPSDDAESIITNGDTATEVTN